MPTFLVQKLVRDRLDPEGDWQGLRRLDDHEFLQALKEKLVEEAHEVHCAKSKDELIDELADIHDVFETMRDHAAITQSEIDAARLHKIQTRGRFNKRQYAESVSLDESHRLTKHCRSQPLKYKEIRE